MQKIAISLIIGFVLIASFASAELLEKDRFDISGNDGITGVAGFQVVQTGQSIPVVFEGSSTEIVVADVSSHVHVIMKNLPEPVGQYEVYMYENTQGHKFSLGVLELKNNIAKLFYKESTDLSMYDNVFIIDNGVCGTESLIAYANQRPIIAMCPSGAA